MVWLPTVFFLASIGLVRALPFKRQAITTLGAADIDGYSPYTHFASAAYCDSTKTSNWTCGANCDANSDFRPVLAGGDGDGTQFWYVGYSSSLKNVIVAHQGTNPQHILSLLTDSRLTRKSLDQSLFPGVPKSAKAHHGFVDQHASTAQEVFAAVNGTLLAQNTSSVTVVGHSLGAALALLDGLSLRLRLDSSVNVRVIGYGMPRVGDQDFADLVDTRLDGQVTHVNNQEDPVPIIPGKFLGFHHVLGEIHINDSGDWKKCPGQDNPSSECSEGDVGLVVTGNLSNHDGPYAGIKIGCSG